MSIIRSVSVLAVSVLAFFVMAGSSARSEKHPLQRSVADKPVYESIPDYLNKFQLIFKLKDEVGRPVFDGSRFFEAGADWDRLNEAISSNRSSNRTVRLNSTAIEKLDELRAFGSKRVGWQLPDISLYYEVNFDQQTPEVSRLAIVNELNALNIVEIAYFPAVPQLPTVEKTPGRAPNWQNQQFYLDPAPAGVDAYYAWGSPGGKGEGIKLVDIEGNWVESHEDLHGGIDSFHIGGSKIADPTWYNHGTAVLGEIAADSNSLGMTGIAFNVSLGTVSIGSMSIGSAITMATSNSDTGDVILIELQIGGPNNGAYVPVEYEQYTFDVILIATAAGRIVVEAGANGAQDLDDTYWYGNLFDPAFRFSGAIMVGASDGNHNPASFTSYGKRVDVHAYGTWNVYTLGYGDLYGSDTTNYYTSSFAGTSSASPIIVGTCIALQGINKAAYNTVLDHAEMRSLLQTYSTPQAPSSRNIGPLPDMRGSVDQIVGVSFSADTTFGWAPFGVNFSGSSGLAVDSWTWDFGDGDSAFVQSPAHTYNSSGMFTVNLEVDAGGDIRTAEKANYIIVLADSLLTFDVEGDAGSQIVVSIYARNTVPIRKFEIPLEFGGDLVMTRDSISVVGCRTEQFEEVGYAHTDGGNFRFTARIKSSLSGTTPDLAPGAGEILKVYFTIANSTTYGQTAQLNTDGYINHLPVFEGYGVTYAPVPGTATVTGCVRRGDMDGIAGTTVSDLTFLVDYLFNGGTAPDLLVMADVDCSGDVNVADLTYMVNYLFLGGPTPCTC